jgi:hypothetical protein
MEPSSKTKGKKDKDGRTKENNMERRQTRSKTRSERMQMNSKTAPREEKEMTTKKEKNETRPSGQEGKQEKEEPQVIKEDLQCGICLDIVNIRGNLDCCTHAFCFECIETWMKTANICPMCKATVKKLTKISPNGTQEKAKKVQDVDKRVENNEMTLDEVLQFIRNTDEDGSSHPIFANPSALLAAHIFAIGLSRYPFFPLMNLLTSPEDSEDDDDSIAQSEENEVISIVSDDELPDCDCGDSDSGSEIEILTPVSRSRVTRVLPAQRRLSHLPRSSVQSQSYSTRLQRERQTQQQQRTSRRNQTRSRRS